MHLTVRNRRKLRRNKRPPDSHLLYFTSTQGYMYSLALHQAPLLQSPKSQAHFVTSKPPSKPGPSLPIQLQSFLLSRGTLCSSELSFLPGSYPKLLPSFLSLLQLCTLTGCLPCSPSFIQIPPTGRGPAHFSLSECSHLSVSMLRSPVSESVCPRH